MTKHFASLTAAHAPDYEAIATELVEQTRDYEMTPEERRAQRVSLIMGLRSERSTLTREKVSEVLTSVEGSPATSSVTTREVCALARP
jgi:hypothetical protein